VRRLQQESGAVAGFLLRPAGAPVVEVGKDLQAIRDEGVRGAAGKVDEGADSAAGMSLEDGGSYGSVSLG